MNEDKKTFGDQEMIGRLVELILKEQTEEKLAQRNEKVRRVLLLLAKGATLATVLAMPGTAKLFKGFAWERSEASEWKMFNKTYLRRTIRNLERQKLVEVNDFGDHGEVSLTENGRKRVLKFGLESLTISKPEHWDGKWRMVFYDVFDGRKTTREKFRNYLKAAGFYPLQKSVYLHAYPCEREIEFLKYFLGISGEVRIVIAEKIENDSEFRSFFGV